MTNTSFSSRSGWFWVPSLYLAEGLPAALVTTVSLVMFSHLGIPSEKALFWTGLYALPWMLRPLWVPVIDRIGTPRLWGIVLQMVMGGLFTAAGAAAAFGAWLPALSCCFFAAAFASATHDAAADGFYIIAGKWTVIPCLIRTSEVDIRIGKGGKQCCPGSFPDGIYNCFSPAADESAFCC